MYIYIIIPIILAILLSGYGAFTLYGRKFKSLLQKHPTFSAKHRDQYPPIDFVYAAYQDEKLSLLREKYELDAVAGKGAELEKIINLMRWVHHLTSHAVNPSVPKELNALHLIELCKTEHKKLNCWMYSIVLNEVYLSFGYPSRIIHLKPHANERKESHFVTSVFSSELGRWIMMDSDMGRYLRDENGNLLGIPEIRERLCAGQPLIVNDDIGGFSKILMKWSYPWYLSKNIFRYGCQQISEFGQESQRENRTYYELIPDGFQEELLLQPEITPRGNKIVYINDETLFWQRPIENQR